MLSRDHETFNMILFAQPIISVEKRLKSLFIRYVCGTLKVKTNIMFRVLVKNDDLDRLV